MNFSTMKTQYGVLCFAWSLSLSNIAATNPNLALIIPRVVGVPHRRCDLHIVEWSS